MIVTLVSFAFFFGILISRIGLPPMVGFLAAGFAYNFAGLDAPEGLQTVADLGVTLLLFSIGLKLKLKDLAAAEVWGTSVLHVVASTIFFAGIIYVGQLIFDVPLFQLSLPSILTLAFGLSFSSTVYAVKVLEDKGDISALYGKVAIGILVMQDIFAVVYLTVSEGKYPSIWAVLVLLLLIPHVRKAFFKLIDYAGHGELLVVSGLFFALGAGYEFFYSVDLKGDLGALILGVIISNHPKAKALAKSLFSFKELMLVGFFLSVGMQGLPNLAVILTAVGLVLLLPFKTWLYMAITTRFGLRDWLLVMAIAVSVSFAVAAPFSAKAEETYHNRKSMWDVYQRDKLNPKDEILDTEDSTVLIIGMGRVGAGAYKVLNEEHPKKVLGIELNEDRAASLVEQGFNVKVADATDTDFWNMVRLSEPVEEMIILAMPNHHSNIYAAERIEASGLDCKIVAIAKHESEVQELLKMGITSFNLYREAGEGLGREAVSAINLNRA